MENTMLMTVGEVAERLKVSKDTVRRWLQAGDIEGLRIGRQWRVTAKAFNTFLFGRLGVNNSWPHA